MSWLFDLENDGPGHFNNYNLENVINNTKRVDTNKGSFEMPRSVILQVLHFQVLHFQSPPKFRILRFDREYLQTGTRYRRSDKKLSYRRETARQLPTWRWGGGLGPPAHSPDAPSGYIYASGRIRNPQQTYVKRAVH